jgi:hypothetical protein
MHTLRKLNAWKLLPAFVVLLSGNVFAGVAMTNSTAGHDETGNETHHEVLLAQVVRPITPVIPPIQVPPVIVQPNPHITPIQPPIIQPGPPIIVVPPPTPNMTPAIRVLPPCQVTTAGGVPSADCNSRFINHDDLYRDIYSCRTGSCYAQKFRAIDRAPMIVVYPQAPAARAQAQAVLRAEMVAGVKAMSATLRDRVNDGVAGLPSLSEIDSLTNRAIEDIERIDQPINETQDERLRRLGLGPAVKTLARDVAGS